jgi:uncharacterized protein
MKKFVLPLLLITLPLLFGFDSYTIKPTRILVFSKTKGFRHASIPAGKTALLKMAQQNNWVIDTTEDATVFNKKSLKKYAAVIFLSTTGNILDSAQQLAFEKYIQSGKGFVGIHAATDTEYDWPWYCKLVGANFLSHPQQQTAVLNITNASHASTKHLPTAWQRWDEWYNFKNQNTAVNVLITIDEKSYKGGENGENHPMTWYHNYDGGRSFYTALGHTDESYSEENFLKHLFGGINYALDKTK